MIQPVLGFLQVLAVVLAIATVFLIAVRWRSASTGSAIGFASMLGGWLLVAGLTQGVPAAVYQATSVGPNEQTAQTPTIADYLTTSRYAWAIESTGPDPQVQAGSFGTPHAPTLSDLESDLGTLQNVRIQDPPSCRIPSRRSIAAGAIRRTRPSPLIGTRTRPQATTSR